jgi:hypothetical protein
MGISQIVDTVGVKNRFAHVRVDITHDGLPVVWEPNEIKYLPRSYADWFVRKSQLKRSQKGQTIVAALVIMGINADESDLDETPFMEPHELIERDPNIPTMFDSEGRPLRAVIVDVTGVAGLQQADQKVNNAEQAANDARSREGRTASLEAVEAIIKAAPEDVIEQLPAAAAEIAAGKHGGAAKFHGLKGQP